MSGHAVNEAQATASAPAQQPVTESDLLARGWKKRSLSGFIESVGPLWTCREDEGWAYGILAEERHLNPARMVHGGLLESLMDHALSSIAWEASGRRACVTLQMDAHFLAPARAGMFIEARGRVLHGTASTLFMQGALTVGGQPMMSAQALMKVLPK